MEDLRSVHWDITRKCNLRCKHCYNAEKYFNPNSDSYIEEEMSLEQCKHTVDNFANAGFEHIHFLGGEPLASPYLFDVIEYAKEKYNMCITINSNACLLTESICRKLIELKVEQYAASLDGCSALVNDSIRGSGTFEKVLENMKMLNSIKTEYPQKMETVFVFTLTKKNIGDLKLLPKVAEEAGVDLMVLTTFIESGNGREHKEEFAMGYIELCDAIETMVSKELLQHSVPLQIDMRPRFCDYLASRYMAPIIYNSKNSLCCAGEKIWYLEANGDAHPCLVFQLEAGKKALKENAYIKEKMSVLDKTISEIENSQYWKTFLSKKHAFNASKISTCTGCIYLDDCEPCFLEYGDYNRPVIECEWTKQREKSLYDDIKEKTYTLSSNVDYKEETGKIAIDNNLVMELDNEVSSDFLDKICEFGKVESALKELEKEYAVDSERLKYDLAVLVMNLINNDILKEVV
ncbi:MAG: radical SAM protein [Lachnospiraceae bacterium]|nr:radical SAM protein [Lachnospiraceae bacterium]